jgi:hypothetical protein
MPPTFAPAWSAAKATATKTSEQKTAQRFPRCSRAPQPTATALRRPPLPQRLDGALRARDDVHEVGQQLGPVGALQSQRPDGAKIAPDAGRDTNWCRIGNDAIAPDRHRRRLSRNCGEVVHLRAFFRADGDLNSCTLPKPVTYVRARGVITGGGADASEMRRIIQARILRVD